MTDLSESMRNLALQLKELCLQCHNAYDHQTWKGSDLQGEAPTGKVT